MSKITEKDIKPNFDLGRGSHFGTVDTEHGLIDYEFWPTTDWDGTEKWRIEIEAIDWFTKPITTGDVWDELTEANPIERVAEMAEQMRLAQDGRFDAYEL